ncbi:cytochrome d ubiquinol oxidase subunit II [Nakamurella sp.]|uniref:cytochrome d ubiquinol oxidase subunit II n=1 Tax=Nakamurella sp. TaxID=1869182 RepID=UPI0037844220
MTLPTVWFVIVAFFWTGFFVLEGFDFGVGAVHKIVGRTDVERRVAINSVGPFWDGNEVWLIVAGAAMFAAFPNWYASWFSALYLALWLLLAALIVRGVSFEFRGKFAAPVWRATWGWTLTIGSVLAPLLIGVGLGDLLAGLPIDAGGDFTGTFLDLLTPFGMMLGVTLLVLCLLHGSAFLTLRTTGPVFDRAHSLVRRLALPALALVLIVAVWMVVLAAPGGGGILAVAVPAVAAVAATVSGLSGRSAGATFIATAVTIGGVIAALFVCLYPTLLVSTTDPAYSLTVTNSSSSQYSLQVMTVAAAVLVPFVLLYQGWTYYVFRRRVSAGPAAANVAA